LFTFNWLFGFVVSIVLYTSMSYIFPAREALIPESIWKLQGSADIEGVANGSDAENIKQPSSNEYMKSEEKPHVPDSKVM
jgi:nucleobase:cation symporter-1, NCS1 family